MKTTFVALAVGATMALGSIPAFAQGQYRDGHPQREWQHQRAEQGRGNWGHGNRYVAPRYYGHSYGYRQDDSGDMFGALALGALTGALIGQASNTYDYAPPATYYTPPATYYNPPATYYAPPATYYTPAPPVYYNPGYGYYGN